jgi:alanyl-tRNA synthetase
MVDGFSGAGGRTHLTNTKEAQAFALVQEVAKGIRSITALTKDAAREAIAAGAVLSDRLTKATKMPKHRS